jgi:hypothetical protein
LATIIFGQLLEARGYMFQMIASTVITSMQMMVRRPMRFMA